MISGNFLFHHARVLCHFDPMCDVVELSLPTGGCSDRPSLLKVVSTIPSVSKVRFCVESLTIYCEKTFTVCECANP